jgi:DNA repair exonuclease SbcCD ATPase subunit
MAYFDRERQHLIEAVNETGEMYKAISLKLDEANAEIERLREALCGIIEADCEAIQMGNGIVNLKPGPYAVIARIALGEGK